MKYFKFLRSTLSMILLFFCWNSISYLLISWYPNWVFLNIIFTAPLNVFIGIMITYNALVAMNKRTVDKFLNPKS